MLMHIGKSFILKANSAQFLECKLADILMLVFFSPALS